MAPTPPNRRHRGSWIYNANISPRLGSNMSSPSGGTAPVSDPFGEAWIAAASKASRGLDIVNGAAIVHSTTTAVNPGASSRSKTTTSPIDTSGVHTNLPTNNSGWQSEGFGSSHHATSARATTAGASGNLDVAELFPMLNVDAKTYEAGPAYPVNTSTDLIPLATYSNTFSTASPRNTSATSHEAGPANTLPDLVLAPNTDTLAVATTNTLGISTQYRGDLSIPENWSADIPADQSTSLYIRGMHPDATFSQILAAIRGVGRIYSLYVNPPLDSHLHPGSAAKLCFFTRAAAERFYSSTRGGFWVMGRCANVIWNRILVPEHRGGMWDGASRVLIIRGPEQVVNMDVIFYIINQHIREYDLDWISEKASDSIGGFREMELHFGSFRAQAHSAMVVLTRELRGSGVRIRYGADPCE